MGKYRSRWLLLMITVLSVSLSAPVFGATPGPCPGTTGDTCFITASGYQFKVADLGTTCTSAALPLGMQTQTLKSFPHFVANGWNGTEGANLWCYDVSGKSASGSSLNQINLQVAVPYFLPTAASNIKIPGGTPFSFSNANGCSGDSSTGFQVGDLDACGVKWTYQVKPGGTGVRFTMVTRASVKQGAGPVIMAAKVGSILEPGYILGPALTSNGFGFTGLSNTVCQVVNGLPTLFKKDDFGCTEKLYVCWGGGTPDGGTVGDILEGNTFCDQGPISEDPPPFQPNGAIDYSAWTNQRFYNPCPGCPQIQAKRDTCYRVPPSAMKLKLWKKGTGGTLEPINNSSQMVREFGFLGTRNACGEGVGTIQGDCIGSYTLNNVPYQVTLTATPPCLNPPSNFTATKIAGGVSLSWFDNNAQEYNYQVFRANLSATDPDPAASTIKTKIYTSTSPTLIAGSSPPTNGTVTVTYTDPTLPAAGTKNCYKILAYTQRGQNGATYNITGPPSAVRCVTP